MKMFLFITFLALELIVSISGSPSKSCPPNQRYLECGICDQICGRETKACTADCKKPGCYCQEGYVRAYSCGSSECVLPSNCPGKCSANEEYRSCGGCDQICNHEPIFCTQDCSRPGCYCKKGFVRAAKGQSGCISKSKCEDQQCRENEVYKYCGCDQYCNKGKVSCSQKCKPGCYCKEGFQRSARGGMCIPTLDCKRQQCNGNQVFKKCGGCDQYCNEGPVLCRTKDCRPGCYCKDGYERSSRGGMCIKKSQCPTKCKAGEVFKKCGGCDQYCNRGPVSCAAVCSPGCYCKDGHKRSPRGKCVPTTACQQDIVVEETSEQETVIEETSEQETVIEETSEQKTVIEETSEQETVIEETSEQETVIEETCEQETILEQTGEQETVVEETSKQETVVEETSEQETVVEESSEQETVVEESSDQETVEETTTLFK